MDRVVKLLRTRREICSLGDFYAAALSNGRNDVATLIARGWVIEKKSVKHGALAHVHYRLISEPRTPPVQQRLAV